MINKLLIALTLLAACVTASADALKEHLWKQRVILTFSANKSSQARLLLMSQIEQYRCEFSSRDLVHLDLIAGSDDYLQLSQRFSVKNKDFQLMCNHPVTTV